MISYSNETPEFPRCLEIQGRVGREVEGTYHENQVLVGRRMSVYVMV